MVLMMSAGLSEEPLGSVVSGEEAESVSVQVNSTTFRSKKVDGYRHFSIVDARGKRAAAFFHSDPQTKLGMVFEAYGRLRNGGDPCTFFFKPAAPHFLLLSPAAAVDVVASKSVMAAAVATDTSEICGGKLVVETILNEDDFLKKEQAPSRFARYARLCLGCALADAAEPDWRRKKKKSSTTTVETRDYETTFFSEGEEDPCAVAERELREAVRLGSRAAKIALARLVVVAAHFEARPTFLDDARRALTDADENSFSDAVAAGTRLAAVKASRLLAQECASENADSDVVATAIAAGANVDTRTDTFQNATVLQWAAYRGHSKVVEALLAAGADPHLANDDLLKPIDVVDNNDHDTINIFHSYGLQHKPIRQTQKTAITEPVEASDETIQKKTDSSSIMSHIADRILKPSAGTNARRWWWLKHLADALALGALAFLTVKWWRGDVKARAYLENMSKKLVASLRASFKTTKKKNNPPLKQKSTPPKQKVTERRRQRDKSPDVDASSPKPPKRTMRTATNPDVADTLATLDLAALSLATLDKLDKLLPELQRRVLKEVLAREQPSTTDDDADNTLRSQECVVCLNAPRAVAFGCGHLCCCEACSLDVADCPVCRTPVASRHRIFNTT